VLVEAVDQSDEAPEAVGVVQGHAGDLVCVWWCGFVGKSGYEGVWVCVVSVGGCMGGLVCGSVYV
jgi:hypothetical protein